jgi:hypothetical protein
MSDADHDRCRLRPDSCRCCNRASRRPSGVAPRTVGIRDTATCEEQRDSAEGSRTRPRHGGGRAPEGSGRRSLHLSSSRTGAAFAVLIERNYPCSSGGPQRVGANSLSPPGCGLSREVPQSPGPDSRRAEWRGSRVLHRGVSGEQSPLDSRPLEHRRNAEAWVRLCSLPSSKSGAMAGRGERGRRDERRHLLRDRRCRAGLRATPRPPPRRGVRRRLARRRHRRACIHGAPRLRQGPAQVAWQDGVVTAATVAEGQGHRGAQRAATARRHPLPAAVGGRINIHDFRSREWTPALKAAGIEHRRIYDMRYTIATWSLAADMSICALARRMGTSCRSPTPPTGISPATPTTTIATSSMPTTRRGHAVGPGSPATAGRGREAASEAPLWHWFNESWARLVSNQRPLACEAGPGPFRLEARITRNPLRHGRLRPLDALPARPRKRAD